jgi:RNA polymerase sigma-70 factor (ECF subfamily)
MLRTPRVAASVEDEAGARAGDGDAHLVRRAAAGDRSAFEQLYRIYHPRLTRFLERMTRRPLLVGELLNDTMFVVWTRAATYNGSCQVSTWIFAIAYRKAMKALERWDEPVPDDSTDDDTGARHDTGPEQHMAQAQLRRALNDALGGLPPEQRAVVALAYLHEIGYREIAEIVGCPVDTVKTRMFYARRRLRAQLDDGLEGWL